MRTMQFIKIIPAFPVHKIDKAVEFYEAGIGFTCAYKDNGFAILIRDAIELHLWTSCDKSWRWRSLFLFVKPIWSGAESFLAGTHSCRIQVEGIDGLYEELKHNGVLYNSQTTVRATDWGTREFPVLDLHGNLLTFYEKSDFIDNSQ
jgi:catechol 2,3-dioxygenase-like lactoylglutathione lyase family enzyme